MGAISSTEHSRHPRAATILAGTVVWDNHGCLPLRADDRRFLPQLSRYRDSGVDVVSLNVGYDVVPWENTLAMLTSFRSWLRDRPQDYLVLDKVEDIATGLQSGRLGVTFDIEGGCALNGDLRMVERYYALGVRWMLIAYNRNNLLGGGCNDEDGGLTAFGRQVVDEMARVGMVVCCSHTGFRTAMDVMQHSRNPVIFSHSNPLGIWRHRRNIRDEAIKACAATGGVVGINGIGFFLGENDSRTETFVRHVDYVVQLVGPRHVGLGLDYVFDEDELADFVAANPTAFPPEEYGSGRPALVRPEQIPAIAEELLRLGYSSQDLRDILGGNHVRIAQQVWR